MKTRSLLIGALAPLAFASVAAANGRNGWYVGLEGGGNWIEKTTERTTIDILPIGGTTSTTTGSFRFDTGWAGLATVGYGFGNRWRIELEGGYRDNDIKTRGSLTEWSAMVNALYDIPVMNRLSVSLGIGLGEDYAELRRPPSLSPAAAAAFRDHDWNFAYQGIAGVSYEISDRLDAFVNYRYLRVTEPEFSDIVPVDGPTVLALVNVDMDDVTKHTATIGLRYHFGSPAAPVVVPPVSTPPEPVSEGPREFIVFFGFNKSNLTAQAQQVVAEAASAAKKYGSASIKLVGHADRSGSDGYNVRLSQRRADAVKGALISQGVPGSSISTSAKGESDPLVPTADGVREPQNRRVHINL